MTVVGPTLNDLEIDEMWSRDISELGELKSLCPKLISIQLSIPGHGPELYAKILVSYGPKLLYARLLQNMLDKLCEQIVAACPNMRCSTILPDDDDFFVPQTRILGPSLEWLMTGDLTASLDDRELATAARGYTGLKNIQIQVDEENAGRTVRGLLSYFKPML